MTDASQPIIVPDFLRKILDEFDASADDFHEYALSGALRKATDARKPLSSDDWRAYVAEGWAFMFDHSKAGAVSEWGTHFGPVSTLACADGTTRYSPDIAAVDAEVIHYWERRSDETLHPVMRARYADLLWDFRKHVTGQRGNVEGARKAIDAYIEATQRATPEFAMDNIRRVARALELAISINDAARIETVRDAMFALYDKIVDPAKGGSWPWLSDILYGNKKVPVTDEQRQHMIESLEDILKRCTNPDEKESFSPWSAESAAQRLAIHYSKEKRPDDVRRVVRTWGESFIHLSRVAQGIVSIGWLQKVYDVYQQHGMREEADQVLLLYKEKGQEAEGQMASIQVDVPVDKEAVDRALDELTSQDVEAALAGVAMAFVPSASRAQELLTKLHEGGSSLMAHFGIRILGDQQILADVGSIESDLDGRVVHQLSQEMDIDWRFLALALNRIREKFSVTAETLLDFIRPGALFDPIREPLLRQGLEAYLRDDHVKAVHVLVPQIEAMLRRLLGTLGQPTSKRMRSPKGLMQEKTLTDILEHEPAAAEFFEKNGLEDWRTYLRMFLTDPRGWNLRNRLAHALMAPHEFSRPVSDWVVHVILMLGLLRAKPCEEKGQQGDDRQAWPQRPTVKKSGASATKPKRDKDGENASNA